MMDPSRECSGRGLIPGYLSLYSTRPKINLIEYFQAGEPASVCALMLGNIRFAGIQ
jgi:hypothetical protein